MSDVLAVAAIVLCFCISIVGMALSLGDDK